ncbi:MAG: RES family NAD+ phosphorylase [Taibaiella sp.]|nr:RES family NAD+ phosphorylase [Taibaiella sp.]
MNVYRICKTKFLKDLSGRGAALYGGRWNNIDTYIVYTAQSRALALLETMVHTVRFITGEQSIATLHIPENSIEVVSEKQLPIDWNNYPPPDYIKTIGDDFIRRNTHLILKVPSALMPEEHNYLINPLHKDFKKIAIVSERVISVDERLQFSRGHM